MGVWAAGVATVSTGKGRGRVGPGAAVAGVENAGGRRGDGWGVVSGAASTGTGGEEDADSCFGGDREAGGVQGPPCTELLPLRADARHTHKTRPKREVVPDRVLRARPAVSGESMDHISAREGAAEAPTSDGIAAVVVLVVVIVSFFAVALLIIGGMMLRLLLLWR